MKNNRLAELDGLRGIAAVTVVLFHYFYRYNEIYGHTFDVPALTRFGSYGVHLFFMISGFVIYWTIARSTKPLDFVWSRFSRLYPVFWASLCITFCGVALFSLPGREQTFTTLLVNITMLQAYLGFEDVDGVYWSLTLEVAFYFWMFVFFSFGLMQSIDKILLFWVCAATGILHSEMAVPVRLEYFFILNYISLFAAGICFYKYKKQSYSIWTHILLVACFASVYISYSLEEFFLLSTFFIVFGLIVAGRARWLRSRSLVYFGGISYALYLVHQNIGYIVIRSFYELGWSPVSGIAAALIVAWILAHLLTGLVERPALAYLRSFYKGSDRIQRIGNNLMLLCNR